MRKLFLFLSLLSIPLGAFAQASPYNLFVFKAQSFSATGQTGTPIQLNGLTIPSTVGSSYASGTITVTGVALATVSFQVMGSSDNGATYFLLPVYSVASPSASPVTTVTATAAGLYQINLAGLTHIKLLTTGTFTATSVSLSLTGSPNASISRNGSGGGSVSLSSPGGTIAVGGTGAAPTIDLDLALANTWLDGMTIQDGLTLDTLAFTTDGEGMTFTNGSEIYEDNTNGLTLIGANDIHLITFSGVLEDLIVSDGVNPSGGLLHFVSASNTNSVIEAANSTSASILRNTKTALLDGTNAIEEQFGVIPITSGVPAAFTPKVAVGDVTTTIANTNIKLVGNVTINGAPPATSNPPFSAINSGTNSTAIMHVGTGASLNATGSGTIDATSAQNLFGATVGSLPFQVAAGTTGYLSGTGLVKLSGASGAALATAGTDYLSPSTGVVSFNTRKGVVSPASGDYTAAQVTNALDLSNAAVQTLTGSLTIPTGQSINTPIIRDGGGTAAATLSGGRWIYPGSSIASNPVALFNGTVFSGGTGTTTLPMFLFQPTGTTSTAWNTGGTYIGVNAASAFTGNLIDLQAAGVSQFSVSKAGNTTASKLTIGAGPVMTSPPEMVGFLSSVVPTLAANNGSVQASFAAAVTVTQLDFTLSAQGVGCTTLAVIALRVNGVNTALTVTVPNSSFVGHGTGTINVPAGQNVTVQVTTPAAGCTTNPATATMVFHYVMQ